MKGELLGVSRSYNRGCGKSQLGKRRGESVAGRGVNCSHLKQYCLIWWPRVAI